MSNEMLGAFNDWIVGENVVEQLHAVRREMRDAQVKYMDALKSIDERVTGLLYRCQRATQGTATPVEPLPESTRLKNPEAAKQQPLIVTLPGPTDPQPRVEYEDDEPVYKDPPRWPKEQGSYVGRKLSDCPVSFLIALRDYKAWSIKNDMAKGTPKAHEYAERDRQYVRKVESWIERRKKSFPEAAL
jgi:hypothetical protein